MKSVTVGSYCRLDGKDGANFQQVDIRVES